MKKCLFCSNRADSLEHVLPQWLLRCVSPDTEGAFPVQAAKYVEGQGNSDERSFISLNFKARIVCVQCNTGWMSDLESEVDQILKPLTGKQFPVLAAAYFDELRKHAPLNILNLTLACGYDGQRQGGAVLEHERR